jgi:hypothetical protein
VSLRALSSLDWFAVEALSIDQSLVARTRKFLASIRGGRCWFCGAPATLVVEVWDLELKGKEAARATLEAVKPSCSRCAGVVEGWASRAAMLDRIARVDGISSSIAGSVVAGIYELLSMFNSISRWEFVVTIDGLEAVAKAIQQLYDKLHEYDARIRHGWLVRGDIGAPECLSPPDPGLILDFLRGVGAHPSPLLFLQPPPASTDVATIWATRIPTVRAPSAILAVLRKWNPTYTEASIAVSAELVGADVPLEIRLPCYDQLQYHEEALSLLKLLAKDVGSSLEANLVLRRGNEVYELARVRVTG